MSKFVANAGWDDVPHLSFEQKREEAKGIPPYQLDARSRGIPQLGSGAIYPVPESDILCDPFAIPEWFEQCYALDVGWNVTAALWGARDPNTDVTYLYDEHYRMHAEPPVHAAAIRARGIWIPGVIDPAARGRGQRDGEQLFATYVELGLETLTIADNGVENGLTATWVLLSTGRLRAFKSLHKWREELRFYQRDEEGKLVKKNDHLMDCMRYLVVSGIDRASVRPASTWNMGTKPQGHVFEYDPCQQK